MAEPQPPQLQNIARLRKKRKKSRYLKQGYHKSERDDYRRVTARAFLSGITRDSHLRAAQPAPTTQAQTPKEERENTSSFIAIAPIRRHSSVVGDAPSPPSTPVLEARYSPTYKNFEPQLLQLGTSKSLELDSYSHHHLPGIRSSNSADYTDSGVTNSAATDRPSLLHVTAKWRPAIAEGTIYENKLPSPLYYETGRKSRVVCIGHTHAVVSVFSHLPYNKTTKSRHDNPRERMRNRVNSFSLQMDLDGVQLGTTTEEVTLAFLLNSIWISPHELTPQTSSDPSTPSLLRKSSIRKSADISITDKRSSTPTPLGRFHLNPELTAVDMGAVFRGDHRSPLNVILNYHPHYLNNEELFASPMTTLLTPPGYRVSIIQYARKSDIKKGLNDRFKEIYPHIEVSLTKLIKIKRRLYEIALECHLDLVAVSYAYVYFEKLVIMGKVDQSLRMPVAGVCLLLAAKFVLDLKKKEISDLIDEITDSFRISTRELLLYEFPVLAILQFSLLTPTYQARPHYDKLVRGTLKHTISS